VFDCPVALNVYPVASADVGFVCCECDSPFEIGGTYAYIDVSHPAVEDAVWAAVCLGCAATAEILP